MPALAGAPDTTRMNELAEAYAKSGVFMGSVLVWKDGQVLLDKGYGYANLEFQVPNAPDTKFRLGSMTKQFTAAAILLLQERGKLKLDDPVKKYIPDAPAAWDKITIRNLLNHTSGVPSFTSLPDFASHVRNPVAPQDEFGWVKDKPLEFAPGTKWAYSNSGYSLLGLIIEKTSGVTYQQFLADNIFKPLGMKDSGYDSNSIIIARHASGYVPGHDGMAVAGYSDMTVPYAAGALYSTTHDILTWDQALFGSKVLKPASLKAMTTPGLGDYGFGFWIHTAEGHTDVSHPGAIDGFNTAGHYLTTDKLAVIVLGNLNGPGPDALSDALMKTALGMPSTLPSERKAVTIDPKSFDALVGTYQAAPQFALVFSRDGDHFFGQGTGQPKIEIFPLSEHEFFAKVADATVRFELDANGKGAKAILMQNGQAMTAVRVTP
jgi:CubicO group peptidase (beta-lactamase class C family)